MSTSRPLPAATRLRKLRAMSPAELATRVRYEMYCRLERARHSRGLLSRRDRLRDGLVSPLARSSDWASALMDSRRQRRTRFFTGVERIDATRALFRARFPAEHRRAQDEARRAGRREFSFFGETFCYPDGIDWNADPVTGAQWPRVYHRDVPVHGGNVGFGDVKHVWELGRQQYVVDLAKAWAIDRDSQSAAACRELVFDWRAGNPVGSGVGWANALEPAFRSLSWLWAYFMTLDDPSCDAESHLQWLEGFHDHGWFLYRHLEYFASPFNHLAGEACALYCLGVLFPEFREAPRWRAHGRRVLETRLRDQFYPDGGSVEQSTFYHHATTGFYLLAALLGRLNGEAFSDRIWAAIERAIEFSMVMQQPDGTTPRIGGADDGKPIRLEHLPLWDFRAYQAVGAVLFGRHDFKGAAGRFYEDALWLVGTDGAAAFDALASEPPAPPSRVLESSGYVVIRNRWASDGDYLCFDCGEQAGGLRRDEISSAAHGHADCLSLIVWRRGRPVLVDAGFHCYNGPKAWQDHFRETAAHNTARIDGHDQAFHINKMNWSLTYAATLQGHRIDTSNPWVVGSHDGYRRLEAGPVIHRRVVWARERGYLVVCDFLDGTGTHDLELTFQFAPGRLHVHGHGATFGDLVRLDWLADSPLAARVHEGGPAPQDGWIAPSLGVKTAAPRLVLAAAVTCPTTVVTVISDLAPEAPCVSQVNASPGPIRIRSADWEDWLLVRGHGHGASHGLAITGYVSAWKVDAGRLVPDGHVGTDPAS